MNKTILLALAPAAVLAVAAAPAVAADTPAGPAFRVAIPIEDLDLTRPEGRAALIQRSRAVAKATCAPKAFPTEYDKESLRLCHAAFRSAVKAAVTRAGAAGGEEVLGTR